MTSADIAELREFISGELQKVHTGLEQVNTRLDQVNTQVDKVYAGQLDFEKHVASHFGEVYNRLDNLSSRLSREGTQREEMRSDFRVFGEGLGSTNRNIEGLRSDMDRGFEEVRSDMDRGFGELRSDMDRGTEELRSDMDRGFGDLREETRAGFCSWGGRVVALEDRVAGMEAKRG
jgi:hypothetical protein